MPPSSSLLDSTLFSIRETAESGRGIYASQLIVRDTLLLETSELAAKVIYREYRKEVCAQCFRYDGGRDWKLKDSTVGVVFCSQDCVDEWIEHADKYGSIRNVTLAAAEALGKGGKQGPTIQDEQVQKEQRPTREVILSTWDCAEKMADIIRAARLSEHPSKVQRRALTQSIAVPPMRDILAFLMSGVLCAALEPQTWTAVFDLATDTDPYTSAEVLQMHITSYHHLLALCPTELLPHINAETLRKIAQKSSHNIFGIWSQDLSTENESEAAGGSEFLGYGLWPAASYFNHSCAPNVRKIRVGRKWQFWAARDVAKDEELCITYLGGDEKELSRGERNEKLKQNWGFDCACERCIDDLKEQQLA